MRVCPALRPWMKHYGCSHKLQYHQVYWSRRCLIFWCLPTHVPCGSSQQSRSLPPCFNAQDSEMISCTFSTLDASYAVAQLVPQPVPSWATNAGPLVSITLSSDELSIVCVSHAVPDGVVAEHGWRCIKLHGPFAFDQVGILASIAAPLAARDIGIFAVSTFDTDYILVKDDNLHAAILALTDAGHVYAGNQG